nr:ATP-grasp fold amidoligase family protein [Shimia biformata]
MPSPADKLAVGAYIPCAWREQVTTIPVKWASRDPQLSDALNNAPIPSGRYWLKSNCGSGGNIPVELPADREKLEWLEMKAGKWLNFEHGVKSGEWWYSLIGKQVFLETDMTPTGGSALTDWKFFTGRGRVLAVQVDLDRSTQHRQLMFDRNFNFLPHEMFFPTGAPIDPPDMFETMRSVAEAIAQPFEFARVDLYETDNRLYLGEITLAPMGGVRLPRSAQLDEMMGAAWVSPFFEGLC